MSGERIIQESLPGAGRAAGSWVRVGNVAHVTASAASRCSMSTDGSLCAGRSRSGGVALAACSEVGYGLYGLTATTVQSGQAPWEAAVRASGATGLLR